MHDAHFTIVDIVCLPMNRAAGMADNFGHYTCILSMTGNVFDFVCTVDIVVLCLIFNTQKISNMSSIYEKCVDFYVLFPPENLWRTIHDGVPVYSFIS